MSLFELEYFVESLNTRPKRRVFELLVPERPEEITMNTWCKFQRRKVDSPHFIRALDTARTDEERQSQMDAWGPEEWMQFFTECAELLVIVCKPGEVKEGHKAPNAGDILRALPALVEGQTNLLSLYLYVSGHINKYQPVLHKEPFTWKGHQYIFPESVADRFGNVWHGNSLPTMASIEALQIEHVLNGKNDKGEYIIEDRKYQVDIALLAILARRVKPDGEIEEMPMDYVVRQRFIEQRIKEWQDAPMTYALDMAFFLTSSKIPYLLTLTSLMPSLHTLITSKMPSASGNHMKSGRSGAGTSYSMQ